MRYFSGFARLDKFVQKAQDRRYENESIGH
jgi:hypothetical protein